jgi:plastocyanin
VRRLLLVPVALAGAALAVVPALGQSTTTVHATPQNTFTPQNIGVKPGDTVRWVNDGGFHNVHFEDGSFNQPPQSSPPEAWPGGEVSRKFDQAGEYRYYCDAHASIGMKGTVYVNDQGTVPATATETTPTQTTPSDTRAPSLTVTARRSTRARGLFVRIRVGERATVRGTLRGGGKTRTVRVRLPAGTRNVRLLRRPKAGRYTIALRATDAAGNRGRTVRLTVTVRR